jgi:hypothetical protein
MLELAKILKDIDNLGKERAESATGILDELRLADSRIADIGADLDAAKKKIREATTSWLIGEFEESPDRTFSLPDLPVAHTVVASDGSQITPNKHEITDCYVLNASYIILPYGTGERPQAESIPKLCYGKQDLLAERNKYGTPVTEKLVGIERSIYESEALEMAIGKLSGERPAVALWDGSLIHWSLVNEDDRIRERALNTLMRLFDYAREKHIPVAGYISDPGSRDFTNCLRIMLCDQDPVNCGNCAYIGKEEPRPCEAIRRLTDSSIFSARLADGERTVVFSSSSKILREYGDHRTKAFYMNAGREIARIEIPEWVAADPQLLDLTHSVCHDQARKGRGYPVALSEAHEHAVIRGSERTVFYEAVERAYIKHGARISPSMKRISKHY